MKILHAEIRWKCDCGEKNAQAVDDLSKAPCATWALQCTDCGARVFVHAQEVKTA